MVAYALAEGTDRSSSSLKLQFGEGALVFEIRIGEGICGCVRSRPRMVSTNYVLAIFTH